MKDNSSAYRFLIASSLTVFLEFLDFTLYGYTASILANKLLPACDGPIDYIWLIFALGLLSRIAGSLLFGHIADKLGTRITLMISIAVMSLSTAGIGCIPTYQQIGLWAPFLLLFLRCLQGFSFAPEYSSVSAYLSFTPIFKNYYTVVCSFTVVFGGLGMACGGWIITTLTQQQNLANLPDSYWRLPYIVSGLTLGAISFYLRKQMTDIKSEKQVKLPALYMLKKQGFSLLGCIMLTGIVGVLTYSVAGFLITYLQSVRNYSLHESLKVCSHYTWLIAILTLLSAGLSEKLGREVIIRISLYILVLVAPISFYYIANGNLVQVRQAILGLIINLGLLSGPLPAYLAQLFLSEYRYTATTVSYNFGMTIFGGAAPITLTYLMSINPLYSGGLLSILAIFAAIPIQKNKQLLHGQHEPVDSAYEPLLYLSGGENPNTAKRYIN